MRELYLYPIHGLYNQQIVSLCQDKLSISEKNPLARANELFWAGHLSKEGISEVMEFLSGLNEFNSFSYYHKIINDPSSFLVSASNAFPLLLNYGLPEVDHFNAREDISLVCRMYSDFYYTPHVLTPESGFILDDYSSMDLLSNALSKESNPYLDFILQNCWPVIESVKPDIAWISGKLSFSTFAMAMMIKKHFKDTHISVTDHTSEYFSYSNIVHNLKQNHILFSVIDSIILDDFEEGKINLLENLKHGKDLSNVPNLLYKENEIIKQTPYRKEYKKYFFHSVEQGKISLNRKEKNSILDSEIYKIKLWKEAGCYWNKCNYCNINDKYKTLISSGFSDDLEYKVDFIKKLTEQGYRFLLLNDEAVPPKVLADFAEQLINRNIHINWYVRSRFDREFTEQLCKTLYKSGLKCITFGLESANSRILKLMNKFPEDYDLHLIEDILEIFYKNKIYPHFCVIVGYPGETDEEREETYNFIRKMKNKFPLLSFTINLLKLFIGSRLYENASEYGLKLSYPCPSVYFIDNIVFIDSYNNYEKLNFQKEVFLKELVYPWYPENGITPIEELGITMLMNGLIRNIYNT